MSYKRLLTIQDISCVGQCSLTVALPIISACGIETAVLPSAVLSTHTAGFSGFTFTDLTDDMPNIEKHWNKEGILFDAIYTGYLGSTKQIEFVKSIFNTCSKKDSLKIVDPAMADNGKLYPAFDMDYVNAMKTLCSNADFLLPNITEACFLTDIEYKTEYDEKYIQTILDKLVSLGAKTIVLTGVSYQKDKTGVIVYDGNNVQYYEHDKLPNSCHGTGDIYASAFAGALVKGKAPYKAAKIAADYTVSCIECTKGDSDHWYGAKFEPVLINLIKAVNE